MTEKMAHSDTNNAASDATLLYFVDPMCSWCWGFAPVASRLADVFASSASLQVIAGGLRVGQSVPVTKGQRETLHGHWQKVAALTGQPFALADNPPSDFIYNSEPACRALVTGREILGDGAAAISWLHRLQQAFYAEAIDVTQTAALIKLAEQHGITGFAEAFESPAMRDATEADFDRRFESAVTGFPTLMLQRDGRLKRITQGYAAFNEVAARLESLGVHARPAVG